MAWIQDTVAAIHARLDPAYAGRTGRLAQKEHDQARRIVWIKVPARIEGAGQVGGALDGTGARRRSIYTLGYTFEAHCYAENEDTLELLVLNLLAAIHRECGPMAQPSTLDWETEDAGKADYALRAQKAVLTVVFAVPVFDEIKPLTTITGQSHAVIFEWGSDANGQPRTESIPVA